MRNPLYFETEQYAETIGTVEFDIIATAYKSKPKNFRADIKFAPKTLKFFRDDEDKNCCSNISYTETLPPDKQILADEIRENLMKNQERQYTGNFFHKSRYNYLSNSLHNIDGLNFMVNDTEIMINSYFMHFTGFIIVSYRFTDILKCVFDECGKNPMAEDWDWDVYTSETKLLNPPAITPTIFIAFNTENTKDASSLPYFTIIDRRNWRCKCILQKNTPPENERGNYLANFFGYPWWSTVYYDNIDNFMDDDIQHHIDWVKEDELNYYEKKALKEYGNANIEFKSSAFFREIIIFLEQIIKNLFIVENDNGYDSGFKLVESESIPTFTVRKLDKFLKERIAYSVKDNRTFHYEDRFKIENGMYFWGRCPNNNTKFPNITNSIDNTDYFQFRIMQEGYND